MEMKPTVKKVWQTPTFIILDSAPEAKHNALVRESTGYQDGSVFYNADGTKAFTGTRNSAVS